MNRRSFLKLIGASAIAGIVPEIDNTIFLDNAPPKAYMLSCYHCGRCSIGLEEHGYAIYRSDIDKVRGIKTDTYGTIITYKCPRSPEEIRLECEMELNLNA